MFRKVYPLEACSQAYQKPLPETTQVVVFDVHLIELILFF